LGFEALIDQGMERGYYYSICIFKEFYHILSLTVCLPALL